MQSFGVIHTRYWMWAQEEGLTPEQTVVGAYLLTCPHGNSLGCFRCPPEYVSADTGYPIDTVSIAYQYLIQIGFIAYCDRTKHVLLCKYLHWNPLQNEKHGKGTAKILFSLPEKMSIWCNLKESLDIYGGDRFPKEAIDTVCHRVSNTVSKPYRYTGTGTGTDTNTKTYVENSDQPGKEEILEPEVEEEKPKTEPKPKTFPPEYKSLVQEIQNFVTREHGRTSPKITDKLIDGGCDAVDKLIRIDGFSFDEVKKVLWFGVKDDFWKDNLKSISQARSKCRNGLTKFQSVFDKWKTQTGAKNSNNLTQTQQPEFGGFMSMKDFANQCDGKPVQNSGGDNNELPF